MKLLVSIKSMPHKEMDRTWKGKWIGTHAYKEKRQRQKHSLHLISIFQNLQKRSFIARIKKWSAVPILLLLHKTSTEINVSTTVFLRK